MEKGINQQLTFKMILLATPFNPVNRQSFIEIITHNSITATPTAANWDSANANTNCNLRDNGGTALTGRIAFCFFEKKNEGLFGSEYSRFRMSPSINTFWTTTGANYFSYIWRNTNVPKQNSIAFDDVDAAILDAYINIYEDTFTQDQSVDFSQGLRFSFLDNMLVKNWTQFTNTKIEFMNYLAATIPANQLDGNTIPTFLRVGGTFDNIDTFNTNKVVLFFNNFEPLFKDTDDPYEVGCSTSATASVRCYYYSGVESALCRPAHPAVPTLACFNQLMKPRLEILFSTTIISISNFYEVQVIIPVKIALNSPASLFVALGTARGHFSTLSAYPQMLSFARYVINRPTNFPTDRNLLLLNSANTNNLNLVYNNLLLAPPFTPNVGLTCDHQIRYTC